MTTVSIVFSNQSDGDDQPISLQVDPWAGFYRLKKGEEIEIVAVSQTSSPRFSVDEIGNRKILLIADSTEYYVVVNGERIHWEQYQLDPRLCTSCLKPLNIEVGLGEDVCKCKKESS